MDNRENVVMEIISTEKSYVYKLQAVLQFVIRPLQSSGVLDDENIKAQVSHCHLKITRINGLYHYSFLFQHGIPSFTIFYSILPLMGITCVRVQQVYSLYFQDMFSTCYAPPF